MPAIQKRTANNTAFPEAKKAKVVLEDPVLAKVHAIITVLQNVDFEVPGTMANREMLVAMAPAVLATPCDARHSHQQMVADTYKELFINEESRLTQQVSEAEVKVTEANDALATRKATVASVEAALNEKNNELKAKQIELAGEVQVTKDAESTMKNLATELADSEQMKGWNVEEHEATTSLKTEHFLVLKEGSWEGDSVPKDHVKALQSFFRKIHVDASMVAALPTALGRKPADRSDFDNLAVSELDKNLEAKLQELQQKIEGHEAMMMAKKAEKEAAESAHDAAKAQQRQSCEALLALKAEQKQLLAELSEKKQAVIEQEFAVQAISADHGERKVGFEAHQRSLSDLTELLERCTPVPEPVPEVVMEEVVTGVATEEVLENSHETIA